MQGHQSQENRTSETCFNTSRYRVLGELRWNPLRKLWLTTTTIVSMDLLARMLIVDLILPCARSDHPSWWLFLGGGEGGGVHTKFYAPFDWTVRSVRNCENFHISGMVPRLAYYIVSLLTLLTSSSRNMTIRSSPQSRWRRAYHFAYAQIPQCRYFHWKSGIYNSRRFLCGNEGSDHRWNQPWSPLQRCSPETWYLSPLSTFEVPCRTLMTLFVVSIQ